MGEYGSLKFRIFAYFMQCKAKKICDEIKDENTEYTKRLGFKITEKEKALPIMYWIPKMHKIQQMHVSSLHLKVALQSKFLNLFPMSLSWHAPKMKIFIKMLNSYQIVTSFWSCKILNLSLNH